MHQDAFLARLRSHRAVPSTEPRVESPAPPKLTERELADRLAMELEAVGGVVRRAGSLGEARRQLIETLRSAAVRRLVKTRAPVLEEIDLDRAFFEAGIESTVCDARVDAREDIRESAFSSAVGLTGVNYGVAETGTLVLLARPAEGRAISLVPPVHIGVLRARDIVFELGELFERVAARDESLPSALTFVTGPSSTADIELVHTVGVHGPRELHLVLLD